MIEGSRIGEEFEKAIESRLGWAKLGALYLAAVLVIASIMVWSRYHDPDWVFDKVFRESLNRGR